MGDFKLAIQIEAFTKNASTSLKNLRKRINGIGKSIKKVGKNFSSAIGSLGIGVAFATIIKSASDAEEVVNKFGVVFQDVSQQASKAAKDLAANYGLSQTAAKELLSDTGDLLTGFGFSGAAALEVSNRVQQLAVDLASFTNFSGGAEGASAALTKALLGETESLKSLGIAINQDLVQKKIQELALQGVTFETERQAKAQATLILATEQSKNAIGDFARSSDSFANQLKVARANLADVSKEFGKVLLPIATKVISKFSELLKSFIDLGEGTKTLILVLAGITAITGPTIVIFGNLVVATGALTAAFVSLASSVAFTAGTFKTLRGALISTGIGALVVALGFAVAKFVEFSNEVGGFRKAFKLIGFDLEIFSTKAQITFISARDKVRDFVSSLLGVKKAAESISLQNLRSELLVLEATRNGIAKVFELEKQARETAESSSTSLPTAPTGDQTGGPAADLDARLKAIVGTFKTNIAEAQAALNTAEFTGQPEEKINQLKERLASELRPEAEKARQALFNLYAETGDKKALEEANRIASSIRGIEGTTRKSNKNVKDFNTSLKESATQQAASGLASAFDEVTSGTEKADKAFGNFAKNFIKSITRMVTETIILAQVQSLVRSFAGGTSTGGQGSGGTIQRAEGGPVFGAGTATSDSIPAMLSNGEFVLKTKTAKAIGYNTLSAINSLGDRANNIFSKNRFNMGGVVGTTSNNEPKSGQMMEVRVENRGSEKQATRATTERDARGTVVSIVLEDLETNGPINRALGVRR